jgi:hypothetical protein
MSQTQARLVFAASLLPLLAAAAAGPTLWRGETDFLSFYAGARLAGSSELYSWQRAHAIQTEHLRNPEELRAYIRPPWYALLLKPLAALPYHTSLWLWQALNVAALAAFITCATPRALRAPLCGWYFPAWINLAQGQDMALLLLCICASSALLLRKRDLEAGVVFSLCSTKAHLFLPLPVYVLAGRKWAFAAGVLAGGVVQLLVSFWAAGPRWPLEYYRLLLTNERNQASQAYMPTLLGLFHGVPGWPAWTLLVSAGVLYLAWRGMRKLDPVAALELSAMSGLLTSPHAFIWDYTLWLPLLARLAGRGDLRNTFFTLVLINVAALLNTEPAVSWVGQLLAILIFALLLRRTQRVLAPAGAGAVARPHPA